MEQLRVEYVNFEEVEKWPKNPKDHDSHLIQRSITKFGFTSPIIVDENSGKLVAGHGRLEALRRLKKNGHEPPARVLVENGKWLVPVIKGVSFKSEDEAKAYLLVDNKAVEVGGWQEDLLGDILKSLDDPLKEFTGFFKDEIDEIVGKITSEVPDTKEEEKTPDPVPEAEKCQSIWNVKEGDVWTIGKHVLACTNFLNVNFDMKFQGVFTSPPYAQQRSKQYGGVEMDRYSEYWHPIQLKVKNLLLPKGHFFINIKASIADRGEYIYQRHWYVHQLVIDMIKSWNWKYIDEFVWVHTTPPKQVKRRFKNFFEPIFWFVLDPDFNWYPHNVMHETNAPLDHSRDKPKEWKNTSWDEAHGESINRIPLPSRKRGYAYPSNVLNIGVERNVGHPAPFPTKLPEFFMKAMSKEGDYWLDPFCGSGSSIVAAERIGRICYGTEIKPEYVAVTLERLKHLGPRRVI